MLLAIDVGNSTSRFGVHDGTSWLGHWHLRTVPERMPDEYAVLFANLLGQVGLDLNAVSVTAIASVVPPVTDMMRQMVEERTGAEPLVLGPGVKTGIRIRTDNPAEVGADLVANAVAAFDRFRGSCIAVDFGSALSFTAVQDSGDLVGVAIAPGLKIALRSLTQNTAQLPLVRLTPPPAAIGRNTIHSIQSGIIFGYVGLVESLVRRMSEELGGQVKVVATGGQAGTLALLTDIFDAVDPLLNLDGLRIVASLNR